MSKIPDDYFSDVSANITDEDRIKAGYKIPKKQPNQQCKIPVKTIGSDVLRGDLTGVALPVPMNFHEGGMFADAADRMSFSKPPPAQQPSSGRPLLIPDAPDQDLPVDGETTQDGVSEKQLIKQETDITPSDNIKPEDKQLVGQSLGPFRVEPLVNTPGAHQLANIGETKVIIGRGPNNAHGRPGFYGGLYEGKRFGMFPTEPMAYNANNVCDVDDKGRYVDHIEQQKLLQLPEEHRNQPLLMPPDQKLIEDNQSQKLITDKDKDEPIHIHEEEIPETELQDIPLENENESLTDLPKNESLTDLPKSDPKEMNTVELITQLTTKIGKLETTIAQLTQQIENQTHIIDETRDQVQILSNSSSCLIL
jgi:hypothetical protein